MSLFSRVNRIKLEIKKKSYYKKLTSKNVVIGKNAMISYDCSFDGYNYIGFNSHFESSTIGLGSYVANGSFIRNTQIGKFCSLGKNIRVIDVTHPSKGFVSTSPSFFSNSPVNKLKLVEDQKFIEFPVLSNTSNICIDIGNDVWIGDNVLIIGPCHIGNGAIIGAGTVVTRDIGDYEIVVGVPARVLRMRFEKDEIEFLKELKWWDKDISWIRKHAELFDDINRLKKQLKV